MVTGTRGLNPFQLAVARSTSSDSELPFLVRDTTGPRRRATVAFSRYWRSMPRLARSLLTLAIIISVLFVCSLSMGDSVANQKPDIFQAEVQARLDNRNEIADEQQEREEEAGREERRQQGIEEVAAVPHQVKEPPAKDIGRGFPKFRGPTNSRQRAVRDAFKHAWKGYKEYAWGHDQFKPISKGYSDWFDTGLTIVDGIDTAIIMGLNEEVAEATTWIQDGLSFEKDRFVNLFEATIRVLGGLLSAYHLTGQQVFADRAEDIGKRLSGAWKHSKSPVPLSDVNLRSGAAKSPAWGADSSLSEVTTVQMEFRDLARVINDPHYEAIAFNTSLHVHNLGCSQHEGLCGMFINANSGTFKESTTITFGARADSYYEYLLKQYLQTGKTIPWLRSDYSDAMDGMKHLLLKESEPNKWKFVGELLAGSNFSPKMDHLVCFLSGTLVLGNLYADFPAEHLAIAKDLGATCQKMYETATGLAPEIAHFNIDPHKEPDHIIKPLDSHCLLRPEAIEAWFYLYRATGDNIYQEWGWAAFEAIEKYAKIRGGGYSSVNNVKTTNVGYRDLMESFFLAETLKYLYLLLGDDQTELPLDKWVFNTEGHPLPIRDH